MSQNLSGSVKLKNLGFSKEEFLSPTEEYHPVYGWFWNGQLTVYTERQNEYDLDTLESGLFGSVKILY